MSKFNKLRKALTAGRTHEGAPGYARDTKTELFLLAVAHLGGEDTFYEPGGDRDKRFADLIGKAVASDPQWTVAFLGWLRTGANMRTVSLMGALEAARTMLALGLTGSRPMVASVLQRADEPGEALAYWVGKHGRAIPKPVKRGVADAAKRLYNEFSLLKYDTATKAFRFADVIDIVHPAPADTRQSDLFKVALERRHGREDLSIGDGLPMLAANARLRAAATTDLDVLLDPAKLREAGMTWEDALSLAGPAVDKRRLWEALVASMGYMALLRNLRNLDEAGVGDEVAAAVAARLADPVQVARSRQFPFRFLAAYEQVPSLRWGHALDKALQASLRNIPALPGRTLVLVDTSASMTHKAFSARSTMTPAKAAAVFGVALAAKAADAGKAVRPAKVDLRGFADSVFAHRVPKGASVIKESDKFVKRTGEVGHGTQIAKSLRAAYDRHDRVVIISDMQTMDSGVTQAVPAHVPIYGFNLGGYKHGAYKANVPGRYEFGGLTDATFRMIPLLEAGAKADWPWTTADDERADAT